MRAASVFDLLPDFSSHAARPVPNKAPDIRHDTAESAPPPVTVEALVAEAVAKAEAALADRLAAGHQEEMEALRRSEAEKTTVFMQSLGRDMGESIAAAIDAMELRLTETIGGTVARMLGGVLGDDLCKRSIDALVRTIGEAVGDTEAIRIGVSGPLSLFEPLKAALGTHAAGLDFSEAQGFDLTVSIDDVVFETRMSEWAAALSEVLS